MRIDAMSTTCMPRLFESSSCGAAGGSPDGSISPSPEFAEAINGDHFRILWIDDDVHSSGVEVRSLELAGFRVLCAETGHEGLRLAQTHSLDVILLDLRLGDESGLDVLELLIDAGVTAPIVVLTGFAEVETAIAAMKLGAADYRTKPFDFAYMVPLLRSLAGQRDHERRHPRRSPLAESEWLRIQCDRFAECVTKRQLTAVMLRILLDRRLTLDSFFGCADSLRLVLTSTEVSLTLLTSDMRRQILRARRPPPRHPKVREALDLLEQGGSKLSQRMFGQRVGLSRAYLSHLLTVQTGRKASTWCRGALMRTALCQILETTEHISQLAYAAGYHHAGQFDRDFANMFGTSPTELRRIFKSQLLLPKK